MADSSINYNFQDILKTIKIKSIETTLSPLVNQVSGKNGFVVFCTGGWMAVVDGRRWKEKVFFFWTFFVCVCEFFVVTREHSKVQERTNVLSIFVEEFFKCHTHREKRIFCFLPHDISVFTLNRFELQSIIGFGCWTLPVIFWCNAGLLNHGFCYFFSDLVTKHKVPTTGTL